MLSVVVLISGSGSNLRAILKACDNPLFPAKVLAVGSDRAASGLAHAEEFGVTTFVVEPRFFDSNEEWAQVLLSSVNLQKPDLVILAGFMKVLPKSFVQALSPRLINLHPSLLPAFPGAHAVRDALAAGAKETGSTIHVVDSGIDTGPVISQRKFEIPAGATEASLTESIKQIEHQHIVEILGKIASGEIDLAKVGQ